MKRKILKGIALTIDVGAPAVTTLMQFPLWVDRSAGATMSGLCVLFLLFSAIPLARWFTRLIKSPSAPIMWGLLFGLFVALEAIVKEMIVIAFVGFIANIIGMVIFKIAGEEKGKEE